MSSRVFKFSFLLSLLCIFPSQAKDHNVWKIVAKKEKSAQLQKSQSPFPKDISIIANNINGGTDIFMNLSGLKQIQSGETIFIPLDNDLVAEVIVSRIKHHSDGSNTIHGRVVAEDTPFILTFSDSAAYARFITEQGSFVASYQNQQGRLIRETAMMAGLQVKRSDGLPYTKEDISSVDRHSLNENVIAKSASKSASWDNFVSDKYQARNPSDELNVITILAYYSQDLEQLYDQDATTRIQHLIEVNNQIYRDSNVNIQLEISELVPVDFPADNLVWDTLSKLAPRPWETSDPAFADARRKRYETGSDAVVHFQLRGFSTCGYSYTPLDHISHQYMFSVVALDCPDYTLAHELGHNMGLAHSRRENGEGHLYHYGVGHGVDREFNTIMAAESSFGWGEKVYKFSSPELQCGEHPCGITHRDPINGADAVRALNAVASQVSNMMDKNPDLTRLSEVFAKIRDGNFTNLYQS